MQARANHSFLISLAGLTSDCLSWDCSCATSHTGGSSKSGTTGSQQAKQQTRMDRKSRASRAASLDETNEEVNLWKQICSSLLKLENVQKESESIVTSVNKLHMSVDGAEGKQT